MAPSPGLRSIALMKQRLFSRLSIYNSQLEADMRNLRLPWYAIRNAAEGDATTEVLIYEEIGGSFGIDAKQFIEDLQGITTPNIDVRINSPGGSVFDSIAIYNALVKHPANVTTYVDALAASGASIIAMAGDKVVMMVGSQLMIHDAMAPDAGNAADHREMAAFLDRQSDNLASIYAAKGGGEIADWRGLMLAETWMFATEAVDFGLADEVYVPPVKQPPTQKDPSPEEPPTEDDITAEDDDAIDESADDVEDSEDESEGMFSDDELDDLMGRAHRLTNRGFKYLGRDKAPEPPRPDSLLADADIAELLAQNF